MLYTKGAYPPPTNPTALWLNGHTESILNPPFQNPVYGPVYVEV